ncbi:MAG: ATP-binding cassette domain-containing protein [Eubacteriales bacterium]|nr:ATP-binding cassette domain-containing protein [Eubacteriales bacterium]
MDRNNTEVLLKVEHLRQYFGKEDFKAVDDVSFSIYKGEVFGLVGESGCGKTTTGRSIIKLYNCTGGNVWFKGQRICAGTRDYTDAMNRKKAETKEKIAQLKAQGGSEEQIAALKREQSEFLAEQKLKAEQAKDDQKNCDKKYRVRREKELEQEYAAKIAADPGQKKEYEEALHKELKELHRGSLVTQIQMIYQDPVASLDPRMTVREIIAEGLVISGVRDKAYISRKVNEMLEIVGLLPEHANRYPHEFSGGQRQRIGIARALIVNPSLLIADEPVSALDVSIQAQVINLLNDLRDKMGLTILFIAHDLSVVKYFSDRIGVMYFGKMVELADSEELFRHPLHPYTKSLLSAIPVPDPHMEKQRVRIRYNPVLDHDYSKEEPTFCEIAPGHFVRCNGEERKRYLEELANG